MPQPKIPASWLITVQFILMFSPIYMKYFNSHKVRKKNTIKIVTKSDGKKRMSVRLFVCHIVLLLNDRTSIFGAIKKVLDHKFYLLNFHFVFAVLFFRFVVVVGGKNIEKQVVFSCFSIEIYCVFSLSKIILRYIIKWKWFTERFSPKTLVYKSLINFFSGPRFFGCLNVDFFAVRRNLLSHSFVIMAGFFVSHKSTYSWE